jgi:hypothetical protein
MVLNNVNCLIGMMFHLARQVTRRVPLRVLATLNKHAPHMGARVSSPPNPQFNPKSKENMDNFTLDLRMHELLPKQKWKEITELFESNLKNFTQAQGDVAITAYSMLHNTERVVFVHQKMKEKQLKLSSHSASCVLICLAQKDLNAAFNLVVDLIQKQNVVPSDFSLIFVHSRLITLDTETARWQADIIFRLIPRSAWNVELLKFVIKEFIKKGDAARAMGAFLDVPITSDHELFDLVFEGAGSDWKELLRLADNFLYSEPRFNFLSLDLRIYKESLYEFLALKFFQTKRCQYGLQVVEYMLQQNFKPSFVTYHSAVFELCKQNRLDSALRLAYTMPWLGNSDLFSHLIYGLVREKRVKDIPDLVLEMLEHISPHDISERKKVSTLCKYISQFFDSEALVNREAVEAAEKKIWKHLIFRSLCILFTSRAQTQK